MTQLTLTLPDDAARSLQERAAREGVSVEELAQTLLRAQLGFPPDAGMPERRAVFAMEGIARGDGTSVADVPPEELLRGFGEQ